MALTVQADNVPHNLLVNSETSTVEIQAVVENTVIEIASVGDVNVNNYGNASTQLITIVLPNADGIIQIPNNVIITGTTLKITLDCSSFTTSHNYGLVLPQDKLIILSWIKPNNASVLTVEDTLTSLVFTIIDSWAMIHWDANFSFFIVLANYTESGPGSYKHIQITPATNWTAAHFLGRLVTAAYIEDSGGTTWQTIKITNTDIYNSTIKVGNAPFSGTMILT